MTASDLRNSAALQVVACAMYQGVSGPHDRHHGPAGSRSEDKLTKKRKIPNRLYKYRSFCNRTLDALRADQLFFADPSTFNDPLDTKPSLAADLDHDSLAKIFGQLVEQRISAEMSAAAKTIRYRGPKTLEHIAAHSRRKAEQMIAEIYYSASDPTYEIDDPGKLLFGRYIEDELLRRYEKGIVSFGERSDCPLMWSHYGDQHTKACVSATQCRTAPLKTSTG